MWQKRRRRRKLQTGSISQWQFHSDRKVQLRWSCGAGCQSHRPVPSGFEHCVRPCSAFTLIFPLLLRHVSHLKGKTNKQCHPSIICQRAHLSCPDTYIMRSRCTRSHPWPSSSDETSIKWSAATATRVSGGFLTHETKHLQNPRDIFHVSMHKQTPWTIWSSVSWPTKAKLILWSLLYTFLLVQRENTWQMSLKTLSFATASFSSKDPNCSCPALRGWKQFKLKIFKM